MCSSMVLPELRRDKTLGCDLEDDRNLNTLTVGCDVRQRTTLRRCWCWVVESL